MRYRVIAAQTASGLVGEAEAGVAEKKKTKHTRTLRMRRLAFELRGLREAGDLSREDVSERTGINEATLYRIETARTKPQLRTLNALLDTYAVKPEKRTELVTLTKEADQEGWLETYPDELPIEYTNYIVFEQVAKRLRNYESLFIPGLLQTEDYARAVIKGTLQSVTDEQINTRVQARMKRQELLAKDNPLQLRAIMDEAALHREVGGRAVMHRQLLHLIEMNKLPHVTVQVIRYGAGAHPGMPGSFVFIEFPEAADPAAVYIDSMAGDLFLESDVDIQRYAQMVEQLVGLAASPDESSALIRSIADGMKD